jgi:hypothetical protein
MSASSLALLAAAALAALGGAAAVLAWRALGRERAAFGERLRDLAARLEAAEQEIARAALGAEVAESVLLEKGVADEEDLESARRQIEISVEAGYDRERDGDLH